jgi:hypothetical protein
MKFFCSGAAGSVCAEERGVEPAGWTLGVTPACAAVLVPDPAASELAVGGCDCPHAETTATTATAAAANAKRC